MPTMHPKNLILWIFNTQTSLELQFASMYLHQYVIIWSTYIAFSVSTRKHALCIGFLTHSLTQVHDVNCKSITSKFVLKAQLASQYFNLI